MSIESDEVTTRAWRENTELIRYFQEQRPQYEELGSEIAYILKKRLDAQSIEYSSVSCRAKTLKSFLEKLERKFYDDPFLEITDFSGVRVVFLYQSDRLKIEKIIESEFEVIEKVDKVEEQDADRFGYGALHYLVNLGKKSSGARYDDLRDLVCEIQVRTVLQDAWAIIDHHLIYKQGTAIPKHLRRQINSLSGLFSVADDQFDALREKRTEYLEEIQEEKTADKFTSMEFNQDTLTEFVRTEFPNRHEQDIGMLFHHMVKHGYKNFDDVRALMRRTKKARAIVYPDLGDLPNDTEFFKALILVHEDMRNNLPKEMKEIHERALPLVDKP